MSQAKVHRAAKARKKWTCGKCGVEVQVGEPVLSYTVGFRGQERRRCDKPGCYPTRSERESSQVAPVYDAVDNANWNACENLDDLVATLNEIAEVMREVAQEYESSEMYEKNEDLQERAGMLNDSADTLEGWEPSEEQPEKDKPDEDGSWFGGYLEFEQARDAWFEQTRDEAQQTADEAEIP